MPDALRCFRCLRAPADIPEVVALVSWRFLPTAAAVARADSTYNAATETFACPPCFAAIGGAAAAGPDWLAPRPLPPRVSTAVLHGEVR